MKLADSQVKVSESPISIDRELKLGDEVRMIINGSVIEVKSTDNQDGTYTVLARVKGTTAEVQSNTGHVISSEE
jgi:dsDNA-specific endonuclease/ATPase MutS2